MSTAYGTGFPSYLMQATARENNIRDNNIILQGAIADSVRAGNRVSATDEVAHSIALAKHVGLRSSN